MNTIFSHFSRRKKAPFICKEEQILCYDPNLIEAINTWLRRLKRTWDDFYEFFEFMGINTPVVLAEFNKDKNSFKCVSLKKEEMIQMTLSTGHCLSYPQIEIIKNDSEDKLIYSAYAVKAYKSGESRKIWLERKIFNFSENAEGDKFVYDKNFFSSIIHYGSSTLRINVDLPKRENITEENSSILIEANPAEMESYLLNECKKELPSLQDIYKKVLYILHIAECNLSRSLEVSFTLSEEIEISEGNTETRIIEKIFKNWGRLEELARYYPEEDEIFHVMKDGSWKYFGYQDGKEIVYDAKNQKTKIIGFGDVLFGELSDEEKSMYANVRDEIENMMKLLE